MKKLILVLAAMLVFVVSTVYAQVQVDGYTRKNGTYVQPHYRSSPNNTVRDNYSYKGNTNPYTGKQGTKSSQQSSDPLGTRLR